MNTRGLGWPRPPAGAPFRLQLYPPSAEADSNTEITSVVSLCDAEVAVCDIFRRQVLHAFKVVLMLLVPFLVL